MSRIYIVTQGCYSDYGIQSVWSTRELAEAAIAKNAADAAKADDGGTYFRRWDSPSIEEWFVDGGEGEPLPYWAVVWHNDMVTAKITEMDYVGNSLVYTEEGHQFQRRGNATIYVFARDAEHAIKQAVDLRAEALAGHWRTHRGSNGWAVRP